MWEMMVRYIDGGREANDLLFDHESLRSTGLSDSGSLVCTC